MQFELAADVLVDPGEVAGGAGDDRRRDDLRLVVGVDLTNRRLDRLVGGARRLRQALPLPLLLDLALPAIPADDRPHHLHTSRQLLLDQHRSDAPSFPVGASGSQNLHVVTHRGWEGGWDTLSRHSTTSHSEWCLERVSHPPNHPHPGSATGTPTLPTSSGSSRIAPSPVT